MNIQLNSTRFSLLWRQSLCSVFVNNSYDLSILGSPCVNHASELGLPLDGYFCLMLIQFFFLSDEFDSYTQRERGISTSQIFLFVFIYFIDMEETTVKTTHSYNFAIFHFLWDLYNLNNISLPINANTIRLAKLCISHEIRPQYVIKGND